MSFRGKHRLYLFVQNPGIFSNPFWSDESKVSFYFFHFIFHFFFAPLHFSFPILWILGRVTNQKLESIIFLLPYLERCLRHSIHFHVIHPRMSPEWGNDPKMTTFGRNETGLIPVIRLIRRSSKTQNDSRMRKNIIFKSFPRNNQTQLSFVGKMFQLWDNGYRWASVWHRMTRKW